MTSNTRFIETNIGVKGNSGQQMIIGHCRWSH